MDSSKGYRLKVAGIADLSQFLNDFRSDAMRVLGKQYGSLVAEKAVEAVDAASLGLSKMPNDPIRQACEAVRKEAGVGEDGLPAPDLNCMISFHMVQDAVLARFVHGSAEYLKAWESMRSVVKWPWHEGERPASVSERNWAARERYWTSALAKPGFGSMKFILVEKRLPDLGWAGIRRHIPGIDQRMASAVEKLQKSDSLPLVERRKPELLRRKASRLLEPELTKESFTRPQDQNMASARLRKEISETRRAETERPKPKPAESDGRAASIDHADILLSSDGRTFMAAPYVGLDTTNRVFVQVGDNHIAVSQGGLQYGYVTDVKKSALDLLRSSKTVILVEVEKKNGERLLRARHVAIVSDISLSESLNMVLGRTRGAREIKEWDTRQ